MGAKGLGPLGVMEGDPLIVQAEEKLIGQSDELVLLVDSSKFEARSSLVLCPLSRVDTVITDDGITDKTAAMLEAADVKLIVAKSGAAQQEGLAS
jgi:DeoR family ulaG and ulaABCDEF operon transcriptional repressor